MIADVTLCLVVLSSQKNPKIKRNLKKKLFDLFFLCNCPTCLKIDGVGGLEGVVCTIQIVHGFLFFFNLTRPFNLRK